MTAKQQILKGYKRQGKRFISPMKQLSRVGEYSYVNDLLPELLWIGLINDAVGYYNGAKVLKGVIEIVKKEPKSDVPTNYALQTSYINLPDRIKANIVERWHQDGLLEAVRFAIAPLTMLYDRCALAFVGPPPVLLSQEVLIEKLKISVFNHIDKSKTPGIVLNGMLLLTRLMAGTIKFAAHIEIPDFDAVITSPDSAEAKHAAAFMRANAGAEWSILEISNDWAMHFWDRNAELSPCELPEFARHDA